MRSRARALLWAILIAAAVGFGAGWFTHMWRNPTPESRARDALRRTEERLRDFTGGRR